MAQEAKKKGRGRRNKQSVRANIDCLKAWLESMGLPKPRKAKEGAMGYYEN